MKTRQKETGAELKTFSWAVEEKVLFCFKKQSSGWEGRDSWL